MNKKKKFQNVLVVLGGASGERAVSLNSGKACIKALKSKGYKVTTFDRKFKNFNLISKKKTDVIFNALHGKEGRWSCSKLLGILEHAPFRRNWLKFHEQNSSKKIFIKHKIRTPKFLFFAKDCKKNIIKKNIKDKNNSFQ